MQQPNYANPRRRLSRLVLTGLMAGLLAGCAGFGGLDTRDFDDSTVGKNLRVDKAGRNTDTKLGNYLAARHATNLRDRDAAATFYDQVLSEDPANQIILDRAFLLQLTAGNIPRAAALAEKVVAQDAGDRTARLVLGVRDIRKGKFADARAQFDAATPGPFTRLVSGLLNAWTYMGEDNPDAALAGLELDDDGPGHQLFSAYHSALIADLAGRTDIARAAYERAMSSSGGGSVRIVEAYGRFLERNGQTDDAIVIYSGYLALSPSHPIIASALKRAHAGKTPDLLVTSAHSGIAETLYGLGSALSRDQGVDVSVLYLQLALYADPKLDVARVLLAELLSNSGDLQAAADAYDEVPSNSTLSTTARIERALLLDRIGRTDDAISSLRSLERRAHDDGEVAIALGDLYRAKERFVEAESQYTKALDLLKNTKGRHWTLYYARGVSRERQGKWQAAEDDFLKALELEPEQPYVLNYLGYSWLEQKRDFDAALNMIERAVAQRPNDGFIVDSLGWAFYQLGRYGEAVEQLERAVELDPHDPTINDHLGDAFWKVGRRTEARFQWQHALDSDPAEDVAARITRKLEKGLDAVEAADAVKPEAQLGMEPVTGS